MSPSGSPSHIRSAEDAVLSDSVDVLSEDIMAATTSWRCARRCANDRFDAGKRGDIERVSGLLRLSSRRKREANDIDSSNMVEYPTRLEV